MGVFLDANSPDRQDHEILSGETGGRALKNQPGSLGTKERVSW